MSAARPDPVAEAALGAFPASGAALRHTLCLLRRGSRLLMLSRAKPPWMGCWTGVGGNLEPGEGALAGALREIREETGLVLAGARLAGTITWEEPAVAARASAAAGPPAAGMHVFTADLPEALATAAAAPRETPEGLLAWREIAWALHRDNLAVAHHLHRALPALLEGGQPCDHRFVLRGGVGADWTVAGYRTLPL